MYINAVANSVTLHLYLLRDFYNFFKIKILYIYSQGQAGPPPVGGWWGGGGAGGFGGGGGGWGGGGGGGGLCGREGSDRVKRERSRSGYG
jgi:hypothetical protein